MFISNDIKYVGVNDHKIDLFEGQYVVPNGMAYNSYVVADYKVAVMDTVDKNFTHEWLDNLEKALDGKAPDYLVVQHMEPDHSANIVNFMKNYPNAEIVSSQKAFTMMKNFFGTEFEDRRIVVGEGDELQFLCDYYDYEGIYRDSYKLGSPITLGSSVEIANTKIAGASDMFRCKVTYRFTDLYNQDYWTPVIQ